MPHSEKPFVGVYHRPGCANAGPLFPLLYKYGYRFRTVTDDDLLKIKPGDIDALLFSGGWYFFGDKREPIADAIRSLVKGGVGAVGICCGQINLCKLGIVPADLITMYGIGPTMIEPVDGKHPVLRGVAKKSKKAWRQYDPFTILRWNGHLMKLKKGAHMIASYDMDKTIGAIASAEFGHGRAVAISPHPEGKVCEPGELADRDQTPLVYDGEKMGTARIIDNALLWATRCRVPQ